LKFWKVFEKKAGGSSHSITGSVMTSKAEMSKHMTIR
jgi:1,2-phenylacetyl-CoA epoxidase PaaB subunit